MNNFEFYNPTRLILGKNEMSKLKNLIPVSARILMLYGGGSIKQNGVYQQIRQSLADHIVFEFGGIEANPRYETLKPAIELARQEKIDFLLAVGGGSVIDATKFVAAAIAFTGEPWDILAKRAPIDSAIEFGCVLTLPATGSEMNCFSVISHGKDKLGFGNPLLYPKFSILDPETTFSLSDRQLGNGIVDAFVHTTEQYLTNNNNTPLQDRMAEGILQTLIEEADKILFIKDNYEARANLMFSATMALNGIIGMGTNHDWATHMIGHELTALYGIDHARTLALVLPSLLKVQREQKREKLIQYAQRVWNIPLMDHDKMIDAAITNTEDFFNHVGVPTKLKYYKIEKSDFPKIVAQVRNHIPMNLGENRDIDEQKILQILEGAY
jgi:NADP-dependent alcohol dehydrogenase